MGGKASKGTPKDKRLKANKPKTTKGKFKLFTKKGSK